VEALDRSLDYNNFVSQAHISILFPLVCFPTNLQDLACAMPCWIFNFESHHLFFVT
jgi:hypothetical protein